MISNEQQSTLKTDENVLDNPKDEAQLTLKSIAKRMGDFLQRGYNGVLPHAKAEPPQARKTQGT